MTVAKLVVNPPEGSGLTQNIVDRHYDDLVRGKPGELIAAQVLLQPVGQQSRRTKDGWKTSVTYELVRLEPARDSHEADNITWEIQRAYENRTSGSGQEMLPMNSPGEAREKLIEALREWASEGDIGQADLDERFLSYFGGPEHAAAATVQAGSLLQLTEFARYCGAVSDPKAGDSEDDGHTADGLDEELDEQAAEQTPDEPEAPVAGLRAVPFQSGPS